MCRFFVACVLVASLGAATANAQMVVQRARLGNNSEAITAIHQGPLAGDIAIMDGIDVRVFTNDGLGTAPIQNLFKILGLGVASGPHGIAYNDAQQRFIFNDALQPNTLFLSDNQGNAQGTITVNFPAGFTPDNVEGLVFLPRGAARFPNRIVEVVNSFGPSVVSRLEVIDPGSGNVVAEILPQIFAADQGDIVTGLGFQAPNHFLVGTGHGSLWQIDFSGNPTAGPFTPLGAGVEDLEGIAQLDGNRIAIAGYDTGKVSFLDGDLNLLVGQDRSDLLGFGLGTARGVAWDRDTDSHLVSFRQGNSVKSAPAQVISLAPSLETEGHVVDLTGVPQAALAYLSNEHLIAVSEDFCELNCSILLYNNSGNLVDRVPVRFNLLAMDFIPTRKVFVARRRSEPTTLVFFSRAGALLNSIDLTSTGIDQIRAIAFFNPNDPTGGNFLISSSGATHQMFVIDSTGAVRAQFDYQAKLGVVGAGELAQITSGPLRGAFSLIDSGEIVIFQLP